jgi:chorismate mutase / prephenate dehydrogenase
MNKPMNEKTTLELEHLRDLIDGVDQQLLLLLRKRLDLVAQVGGVKHNAGVPIYAPQREASMLAKRRDEAAKLGISPQLIEDVLRRLMRESYLNEKDVGFKQVNPVSGHIVIVGGGGKLGTLFRQMLSLSGYQVKSLDKDDWDQAKTLFSGAAMVIVSVPISQTCALIRRELTQLPADCILADLTSVKSEPLQAMLDAHKGPVLGLHPMFGPDVGSFAKQVIVVCHGRGEAKYQWFLEQIAIWGARIEVTNAKNHDDAMQLVQAMRHFSSFVYGLNLFKNNADITNLLRFSSPIYRLELAMVGRLFAQAPELYADIILAQPGNVQLMSDYLKHYQHALETLKRGDRDEFIRQFSQVSTWFGDYAPAFARESGMMLESVNDMKPSE